MAEHSSSSVTVKSNNSFSTDTEASFSTGTNEEQNDKVTHPMLVSESTVEELPPSLRTIIENFNICGGSDMNKADLLVSAIYVLMLETGFIPTKSMDMFEYENIDFHWDRLLSFKKLPDQWKLEQTNTYKINFILQLFPSYRCRMTCLVMNTQLIVNIIVDKIGHFSKQFYIDKYVPCSYCKKISYKFRHLNELSIEFKNSLSNYIKNEILREEGLPRLTMEDLPTEIFYKIFSYLPVFDSIRFNQTCKRVRECGNFYKQQIWKDYVIRDFPDTLTDSVEDWYYFYIKEYQSMLRQKAIQLATSWHSFRSLPYMTLSD